MIGAPPLADPRWPALLAKILAQPNILYLGGLSQDEVNDCISRSHIFVNTSVQEGFANTFIQAWMRRVPVVSLAVDPDGLLGCGKYGYCAGDNYHAFRRHIETLVDNPALRQTLGEQAKQYSHAAHSHRNIELLINVLLADTAAADSSSSVQL
jgi:glycosyltransferase involved in cell wall biosynthesis